MGSGLYPISGADSLKHKQTSPKSASNGCKDKFFKLHVSSIQSSNSLHTCYKGIKRIFCVSSTNFPFSTMLAVMYMEIESWTNICSWTLQ
jgi:hypothetical protein